MKIGVHWIASISRYFQLFAKRGLRARRCRPQWVLFKRRNTLPRRALEVRAPMASGVVIVLGEPVRDPHVDRIDAWNRKRVSGGGENAWGPCLYTATQKHLIPSAGCFRKRQKHWDPRKLTVRVFIRFLNATRVLKSASWRLSGKKIYFPVLEWTIATGGTNMCEYTFTHCYQSYM